MSLTGEVHVLEYHPESLIVELNDIARRLRLDVVEMVYAAQSGHPGGSLSAAEIMAALFFHQMRLDPKNPRWEGRDRFILSKGHAAPVLYATLAERGYFPREELKTLRQLNSRLQGHPDRLKTPGVEMTSGALGHGISIGAGLALAARLDDSDSRTYVLVGDGEIQAGVVWEGVMLAAAKRLANLTVILDYNDVQLDGFVHDIIPLEPVVDKWQAFGWHTLSLNGHNLREILDALDEATNLHDAPTVLIARTTKGKGVSYMENRAAWHGQAPTTAQYEQALAELGGS
jgi:transketolase